MGLKLEGLLRKQAAVQVHEYLREKLSEADEIDVRAAYSLRDLFDCRVCAGHIMQVYVKGIMDSVTDTSGQLIFGTERKVSPEEAEQITARVMQRELRKPKAAEEDKTVMPGEISEDEAFLLLGRAPEPVLIDVRTKREFEAGHIKRAENIPLMEILKNPYGASACLGDGILVYCEEGMQSRIAAQCLLEAGYRNVQYFAWKKEE